MEDETYNDFVAWCRTKPPKEGYNYTDSRNCAFAQFLKETGRAVSPCVSPEVWLTGPMEPRFPVPYALRYPLTAGTFGGILERLA